jgi:hypothetical protein
MVSCFSASSSREHLWEYLYRTSLYQAEQSGEKMDGIEGNTYQDERKTDK